MGRQKLLSKEKLSAGEGCLFVHGLIGESKTLHGDSSQGGNRYGRRKPHLVEVVHTRGENTSWRESATGEQPDVRGGGNTGG